MEPERDPLTTEPLCEEFLDQKGEKKVFVGSLLSSDERERLVQFLKENQDVFAWSHRDMPGINPAVACHKLHIDPSLRPYRQRQRRFAPERNKIISEEIDRLLEVGFIREV